LGFGRKNFLQPIFQMAAGEKAGRIEGMSYSLGDLILAVSSYRKKDGQVVAAVADLLESGTLKAFGQKVAENTVDSPPEVTRALNEHFWELI
jgi:hypothetical protein